MDFDERRRPSIFGYFFTGLIGAVIGGFILLTFGPAALFAKFQPVPQTETKPEKEQVVTVKKETSDVSSAASKVMPSVVGITTTKVQRNHMYQQKLVQGVGSGIIVDPSGYILTNNHVADINSKNITVSLYDGREAVGRTIWADPVLDISIVKIDVDNLTAAFLGDSSAVKIGEVAIAIGNPLGLKFQRTVTAGIISALNRTIEISNGVFMEDLIQTDASINPGNSGGPLISISGDVVGINTVKVTSAEGIGFAVPVNIVKPVIKSIKETGKFITPELGIQGFDKEVAGYYDFKVEKGIYIYNIVRKSPAAKVGLKEGDVITAVNGASVDTMTDLKEGLYSVGVGNTVKLKIKTPIGTEKDIDVQLEASR